MIEVVSSSDRPNLAKSNEIVDSALKLIVEHYQDPVYQQVPEVTPYFDEDADDRNPQISPVLQHWIHRVKESIKSSSSGIHDVCSSLMDGYTRTVRPAVFRQEAAQSVKDGLLLRQGVPVLQQYEIFLSRLLEHENCFRHFGNVEQSQNLVTLDGSSKTTRNNYGCSSLEYMASDITYLTQWAVHLRRDELEGNPTEVSPRMVTTVIIPTMIRLVMHHLDLILVVHDNNSPRLNSALQKCATVMLAFVTSKMDPRDILSDSAINTWTLLKKDPSFLYIPILHKYDSTDLNHATNTLQVGSFGTDESFWGDLRIDGTSWCDPKTGITGRTVEKFWWRLYRRRRRILLSKDDSVWKGSTLDASDDSATKDIHEENNASDDIVNEPNSRSEIIRACLRSLTVNNLRDVAKTVRAHFFGRDVITSESRLAVTGKTTKRLHLGWEVEVTEDEQHGSTEGSFLERPSRIHVALQYVSLLERGDLLRATGENDNAILEEMLPILYELLSAPSAGHIAMGSAALIHILLLMIHPDTKKNVNNTGISCDFALANYMGTLLPVLDLACQTCREGPPFFFLARAQSLLCLLASASADSQHNLAKHRRKTTRDFLFILERNNHKVSDPEGLLWALLVGGIIPLLYQHATIDDAIQNVDCMEMGRAGLASLLPVIRYSSGWSTEDDEATIRFNSGVSLSRKLLAPSVVALVHLLHAAYPIMPRHGGKIMSEIVALMGNLQRQTLAKAEQQLLELVKDTAGVILIVCGDRASQVLKLFSVNDGQDFEDGLAQVEDVICQRAQNWKNVQRGLQD